jgi:hypothetical protein
MDGPHLLGDVGAAILHKDGKVRTEKGTQAAVDALGIVEQLGGMIAFGIGPFGHDEHVLGAELDAETAPLAPFLDDLNHAARNLDAITIQRLSPITHGLLLRSVPNSTSRRYPGWRTTARVSGRPDSGISACRATF